MNLRFVHYVVLGLGVVALVSQSLSQSVPQWSAALHMAGTVAVSLASTLGVLCPSAAAVDAPKAP
jgi:hypothetical protein